METPRFTEGLIHFGPTRATLFQSKSARQIVFEWQDCRGFAYRMKQGEKGE